jgi:sulfite exporter TauE/SafE
MEAVLAGILYGMASGWHCMGMCTPLYHVFIGKNKNEFGSIFIYFIGKLSGYLIIFSLFYVTLNFLKIYLPVKFLHILSLILGIALILITLFKSNFLIQFPYFSKLFSKVLRNTRPVLFRKYWVSLFNGLIPCHLSYFILFLVASIYDIKKGLAFLLVFNLITTLWIIIPYSLITLIPLKNQTFKKGLHKFMLVSALIILLLRSYQGITKNGLPQISDGHTKMFCIK